MSLLNFDFDVRIRICRTRPFLSGYTSSTMPRGHCSRHNLSSNNNTRSLGCKFRFTVSHFCRSWSRGKYSLTHLFHNTLASCWACLHRLENCRRLPNFPKEVVALIAGEVACLWLTVQGHSDDLLDGSMDARLEFSPSLPWTSPRIRHSLSVLVTRLSIVCNKHLPNATHVAGSRGIKVPLNVLLW